MNDFEQHLSPTQLEALREICRDLGIDPSEWEEVQSLRSVFTFVAGVRLARELREREGLSRTRSLQAAANRLGMSSSALTNKVHAWL